ncbi:hypothetical protein HOG48_06640 [Candidatus Peregrinibacteria bacterium]|nr:hypothetical protein [Candidatus Peregrinibacteria bacterium]
MNNFDDDVLSKAAVDGAAIDDDGAAIDATAVAIIVAPAITKWNRRYFSSRT